MRARFVRQDESALRGHARYSDRHKWPVDLLTVSQVAVDVVPIDLSFDLADREISTSMNPSMLQIDLYDPDKPPPRKRVRLPI